MSSTNLLKTAVLHNSPRGIQSNLSSSPPSSQPFSNKNAELTEEEFEQYLKKEAERFEELLSSSTTDPLQRAIQRRDFYFKQAESRSERSRKLNTLKHVKRTGNQQTSRINYPIKNRIFEAGVPQNMINLKQQKMISNTTDAAIYVPAVYFGANLSERLEKEQKHMQQFYEEQQKKNELAANTRPVFLGEDGSLYDMEYRPLYLDKVTLEDGRGKLSHLLAKSHKDSFLPSNKKGATNELDAYEFVFDPELYESTPVPESFSSFEEYEEALVNWAREVQFSLGYTQLPKIIGRHYFRPYAQSSETDKEATVQESSPTINPTGMESPLPSSAPGTPGTGVFGSFGTNSYLNSPTSAGSPFATPPKRQRQQSVIPALATAEMLLDIEETWESHLLPLEPKPEFYNTFEEYEIALIRWAVICNGIEFVPPHPAQLQNLIGIKMNKPPGYPILGVKTEESKSSSDRVENAETQFKENKTKESRSTGVVKRDFVPTTVRNDWTKLSKANQEVIDMALRKVLDLKITNRQKFGTFARDMWPRIHGTFEEETKIMRKVDYSNLSFSSAEQRGEYPSSVKEWVYFQRQDRSISKVETEYLFKFQFATVEDLCHQIPLRLTDLSEEDINKGRDCPPVVNKKQVMFKVPAFDIGGIAFELLKNPSFVKFLQNLLVGIDQGGRYSDLTECHYPKDFERAQKMVQQLEDLVKNFKVVHPSQVTVDQIKSLFTTDAYLDTFIRFLRKKMPEKVNFYHKGDSQQHTAVTYKDLLESALIFVPQLFKVLLNYFEISSSRLTHSKIGAFCFDLMKNKKVDMLFDQIIKQRDVTNLYFIAKAITFYDEVPIDIFQYTIEAQGLLSAFLPREVNTHLINPLFVIYYLDLICVSLVEEDKEYTVYNLLIQQLESGIKGVMEFLGQTNYEFLSKQIWTLLGHRNRLVSQVGNFLLSLLFFLSECNTEMTKILKSPDTQLANNLRHLAQSKFSHVQEAVSRLNPTITNSKWKSLMYNIYNNSTNIIADLFQSCHRIQLDFQPPLISRVALHFLTEAMDAVSFNKLIAAAEEESNMRDEYIASVDFFLGLVETKTFQNVLQEITDAVNTKRIHQGILQACMFLAKFAKFAVCMDIAKEQASNSTQKPKPKWGGFKTLLVKDVKKKQALPLNGTQSASTLARLANAPKGKTEVEIGDVKLEISYDNLQQIFDLICSDALAKNKKAYKVRNSILDCFRYLIKVGEIYDLFFKRESNSYQVFYGKLLELCKDGTDMQFNRNCWKLFYQLIKFHASSSMDPLIKTGQMSLFLEMMSSPNSNNSSATAVIDRSIGSGAEKALQQQQFTSTVMTNALLYFNKILNLPDNTVPKAYRITIGEEDSNPQDGEDTQIFEKKQLEKMLGSNKPQPDVTKQYEKTVSKLCDYIVSKHMFIIIFMAFQKLKDNYSGWPFQALVGLFATINNHSICSKLLVSLRKIPEYKDTLQGILELLKGKDGVDVPNGNYSMGQDS